MLQPKNDYSHKLFVQTCGRGICIFGFLLLFLYYNQAGPFSRSFQVIKSN